MQSGLYVFDILAEPLDDCDGVARNRVIRGRCPDNERRERCEHDDCARAAVRHDLLEPFLPLADELLELGAWIGATARRAASVAVTVLRWHVRSVLVGVCRQA